MADFRTLDGDMTPEFLTAMQSALAGDDVHHWRIGNRIYLRFLTWVFPEGAFDSPGSGDLLNAQLQAVLRLVDPTYSDTHVGKELGGRIYQPPGYLQVFLDEDSDVLDSDDCTFVRAVAFGEPPPPGYQPEPSFLDAAPGSD